MILSLYQLAVELRSNISPTALYLCRSAVFSRVNGCSRQLGAPLASQMKLTISIELIIVRIRQRLLWRQMRKIRPPVKPLKVHRRRLEYAVNVGRFVDHQNRTDVPL